MDIGRRCEYGKREIKKRDFLLSGISLLIIFHFHYLPEWKNFNGETI